MQMSLFPLLLLMLVTLVLVTLVSLVRGVVWQASGVRAHVMAVAELLFLFLLSSRGQNRRSRTGHAGCGTAFFWGALFLGVLLSQVAIFPEMPLMQQVCLTKRRGASDQSPAWDQQEHSAMSSFLSLPLALGDPIVGDPIVLIKSNGTWHRRQLPNIDQEASCGFNRQLKNGCIKENLHDVEKDALIRFFVLMHGFGWRQRTNWNITLRQECDFEDNCVDYHETQTSPCWDHWYGIRCNEWGRVIDITMVDNRLNGTFQDPDHEDAPQILNRFSALRRINLSTTRESYHNIENMNRNKIFGLWPSMEDCLELSEVDVSGNFISEFPEIYKNGRTLLSLSASRNRLTKLPSKLEQMEMLELLDLHSNVINERVPVLFGRNMGALRYLDLSYNQLYDTIRFPQLLADMGKMRVFSVSHNEKLTGDLPSDIVRYDWKENEYIAIFNTTLSGPVARLCVDVPFCFRFMYNTHDDMTWAGELDPTVEAVMTLALTGGTTTTTTTTNIFMR